MKRLTVLLAAFAIAALAFRPAPTIAFARSVASHRAPASVWDSIYTDSQTVRGDSLYQAVCIKCHGPTLAGTEDGNPLVGDDFMANWDGLTLDQIYSKILEEMPPDNPNTIPHDLVPDVMAFILKHNGFPAGVNPLPDSKDVLRGIKFQKAKPAGAAATDTVATDTTAATDTTVDTAAVDLRR